MITSYRTVINKRIKIKVFPYIKYLWAAHAFLVRNRCIMAHVVAEY